MRCLPILVGDHIPQSGQPVREPYRVVWNPSVIYKEQEIYLTQKKEQGFDSAALSTAILTDYESMDYSPKMLLEDYLPLDVTIMGFPILTASRPKYPIVGMRINKIHDIAAADRRGILPKVFQSRLVSTAVFAEMDFIRYSLNASGTKYLCLRLARTVGGIVARLRYCQDGQSVISSDYKELVTVDPGTHMTDSLRFIIFGNRIELHLGDPGDKQLELTFLTDVVSSSESFLEIIREDYREDGQDIPVIYGIDGLYVYDGYY